MKEGALLTIAAPEVLLRGAEGKVWQSVVSSEEFDRLRTTLKISSAIRKPDGVHIRFVGPEPAIAATAAEPELEDAFLYLMNFGATRMSESLRRIAAIVRADFLLRFRRVSTLVVFLLLSAFAYVWIPAPSTGRALIQINGQRAIYNSGAIGMGTASLGMMFVGLFGYYVISNAVRRDIVSRCGVIVASTPMRSGEYLLGKFIGNLAFLTTFLGGFMLSSMAMLLVRGEAPIEPLVFVRQYLLLTPAAIVFVSAVAVLFESIRFLSGKIGDVFYFFFFMAFMGLAIGDQVSGGRMNWARCFDFSGFGFMIDQMTRTLGTTELAIGSSSFDPTKEAIVFPGLRMDRGVDRAAHHFHPAAARVSAARRAVLPPLRSGANAKALPTNRAATGSAEFQRSSSR